ncbi:hypothetical protein OSB04_024332 [Centaurea solstitialis]|uniref:Retrotransposon gag domain-containing protein n=1 Tax=Centaurea solstitialis TaxID=347529 RepID=A0AA38WA87_9ASTR|nr:hypothetical protein OSB04_024332 [Centaurea solstitialis]
MANTVTNTNNLSLRSILEKDKLTGPNFLDWERNLMIVLRHERKWYVLEEPLPEAPPANAPAATRNAHKRHTDDLLRWLMNTSAYDMIRQLWDMFQTQARTERYDATKAFNECKMIKGASVSDHVMKMKRHMDHLERLGHPVPLQLATDTILDSLSEDYKPFVVNYNMNNMEKSIAELHSMLKTAELNMGAKSKPKDVLMVRDGGVKKKHGQGSISKGKGPTPAIQNAPQVREKVKGNGKGKKVKANKAKTENRCFTSNEVGHWRQNCPRRHEAGSYSQMKYCDAKGKANIPKFMNSGFIKFVFLMEMFHHLPGYKSAYNLVSLSACLGASLGPCDQGGIANLHKIDYGWINLKQSRHVRRGPREDSKNYSVSMAGRSLRSRVIPEPEAPPPPTRTTAVRGMASGRGKGRGKGRPRKAATVVDEGPRRQNRGNRRVQSEGPHIEPEPSHQESSASQPEAFVTHEAFQTEMGKIQDALQTLLNQQEKSKSDGGREDSGMTSPPATVVGGGSQQTPLASGDPPKSTHGCSYKAFVACKPPTYKGECDPVLALRWIEEIKMVFETCKCAAEDKVVFARSMLKADALHWSQFCPLAATKKMEEEFLQLRQGIMSVQEYTTRFIEKSRFTEVYVPTEERRVERYIWGLKGSIQEFVMGKDPTAVARSEFKAWSTSLVGHGLYPNQAMARSLDAPRRRSAEPSVSGGPRGVRPPAAATTAMVSDSTGGRSPPGGGDRRRCYLMLATMSPDFRTRLINTNAYNMIRQLRDMFQTQACTKRYDASRALNACKMAKGTSVIIELRMGTRTKDVLMVKNGEVKKKRGHGNASKGKGQVLATLSAPSVYNNGKEKSKGKKVKSNRVMTKIQYCKCHEVGYWTKDVLMVKNGEVKKKRGHGNASKGKGQVLATLSAPSVYNNGKEKSKGKKVKSNRVMTKIQYCKCHEVGYWRHNCPKHYEAGINTSGASLGPCDQDGIANLHKWESVSNYVQKLANHCFSSYRGLTPARGIFVWSITGGSNSSIPVRIEIHSFLRVSLIRGTHKNPTPTTFQAAINAAELIEREKDRQMSKQVGEKRKWSGPFTDLRGGKAPRFEHRGGQSLG